MAQTVYSAGPGPSREHVPATGNGLSCTLILGSAGSLVSIFWWSGCSTKLVVRLKGSNTRNSNDNT